MDDNLETKTTQIVPAKKYSYEGLKTFLQKDASKFDLNNSFLCQTSNEKELRFMLENYQKSSRELVIVYGLNNIKPKDDFLGAYFTAGRLSYFDGNQLMLKSPEHRSLGGIKIKDSWPILISNVVDIFDLDHYRPHNASGSFTFEKMHCDGMPMKYVNGNDSVDAFINLIENEDSLMAERKTGYTTPVKLVRLNLEVANTKKDEYKYVSYGPNEYNRKI